MTYTTPPGDLPQPARYADAYDEFFGPDPIEVIHKDGTPRIVIEVPGIEGFTEVAALLQQAGAEIADQHRTLLSKGTRPSRRWR